MHFQYSIRQITGTPLHVLRVNAQSSLVLGVFLSIHDNSLLTGNLTCWVQNKSTCYVCTSFIHHVLKLGATTARRKCAPLFWAVMLIYLTCCFSSENISKLPHNKRSLTKCFTFEKLGKRSNMTVYTTIHSIF